MRQALAKLGRKALILGALLGAPMMAAAPAAQAQPIHAQAAIFVGEPAAELVPVQYYGERRRYYGPRHYYRPPPPRYYRRHYAGRGYGPPPRYYRHGGPRYYR
jgi:hypothetical protein